MGQNARMGLPEHIDELFFYKAPEKTREKLYAVVNAVNGGYDAQVVDKNGVVYLSMKGYRTAELPGGIDTQLLEPVRAAMQQAE